jgi:hypothetical protein
MTTTIYSQPNWWDFPPMFVKEPLPPLEVLIDIYSDQSLGTLMRMMWEFFEATQRLKDDELTESRSDILYYYTIFARLTFATWQLAQETGRVPRFANE